MLRLVGLDSDTELPKQSGQAHWPQMKERYTQLFRTGTRDERCGLLENTDACFAPVLTIPEAKMHLRNVARGTFVTDEGIDQPAPAPPLVPPVRPGVGLQPGQHTDEVLADFGFSADQIATFHDDGAIR